MAPACTAGFSALALAVRHRHEEIAEILLSHGADPDQNVDGEKIIVHSAVIGEAPMVKVLLSGNANPDCTTKDGLPLLFFLVALAAMKKKDPAAYRKMVEVITLLAQNGCPCNIQGPGGFTPLHIAGEIGDENLIKELLACGADRNARTVDGKTAADIAAEWAHEEAVKYLRHGLDADGMQASSLAVDIKEFMQAVSSNAGSALSLQKNVPQPEQPDDNKYQTLKQAGNKAFVSGEYGKALDLYKKALCHNTQDSKLWSDAAAAALRLHHFQDALKHAQVSRTVDSKNVKAWYREGKAAEGLDLWEDAAVAYYEAFILTAEGNGVNTLDVDFALLVKEAVEKGRQAFKLKRAT